MKVTNKTESTFSIPMTEFKPLFVKVLKESYGIDFGDVIPEIRVRKKTAVINQPDTIEVYGIDVKSSTLKKRKEN